MRADRLVATLLILQARGRVTAGEVAEQLEVSERTARRDLEALGMAGIPVYSQQGRGGGWSLLGGARTDLSGLTAAEARALFLVTGPSSAATPEVKAALRKLVRALPESFRAEAEAAATAVVVDPASWGRGGAGPPPEHLEPLQHAVVTGVQVRLGYAGRDRPAGERIVHPLGLVAKNSVWYLVGDTDAGLRTFRVSRVTSVTLTAEPVRRPDGFDLAEAWRSIAATVDERRASFRISLLVDPRLVPVLRHMFGATVRIGRRLGDGRVELDVGGRSAEAVAAEVAGFGTSVEVTAPVEGRRFLARLGADLASQYRDAD
ncbi:MAG: WYL domain-containing protein [Actinomycetota bacterium]|nr:WYL domain-containing protein [Actinomycetota bacterium]